MTTVSVREAVSGASHQQFIDIFSSGGFVIPGTPEPLVMNLYFSSPAFQDAGITFAVNRLTGATKQTVIEGDVVVPALGVAAIRLDVDELNLAGEKIEVVLRRPLLPNTQIHPSASIMTTNADAGTRPVIFLSTGDFEIARELRVDDAMTPSEEPRAQGVPAFLNPLTWGIFDVPEAPTGAETVVEVRLSSVSDQLEVALVTLNAVVEGTTMKRRLIRQLMTVPPRGAEVLTIFGLEGAAVEVIVELPFAQPPVPVLPLLTPSIGITSSTDPDTAEPLLFLAPGQARFL